MVEPSLLCRQTKPLSAKSPSEGICRLAKFDPEIRDFVFDNVEDLIIDNKSIQTNADYKRKCFTFTPYDPQVNKFVLGLIKEKEVELFEEKEAYREQNAYGKNVYW